ncbi:histidine kinase/DNA gyrase B/HSP90-like ATPase [Micromonospora sp. Llam0]|uniref:sensor histidine kinase n=1 Tax=Micromonospora sp. Llam0 TaxID=2485143 RepID=UPI000F4AF23C|nr:sensor histidine kinase [Micromonospora sp. Llam0]ROO59057.1 histidine kinase/DNA gyrase B/HSP90-like ATPase [Micromonospora sp. Llam0]
MTTGRDADAARSPDTTGILDEIFVAFTTALRQQGNQLISRPEVVEQLAGQVASVLDDVAAQLELPDAPRVALTGEARLSSVEIGAQRAEHGIHPVESLRAAITLFEVGLPIINREFDPSDSISATRISNLFHKAIMARVAIGSMSYVTFLMAKLQESRQEERRRIARELHDRVLHGMSLTLHRLDLNRHYAEHDQARARAHLDSAVEYLGEAVRTVQQLSAELRCCVGEEGLASALRDYLKVTTPPSVRASLRITGDAKALPPDTTEELYLILREAVRNALRHAAPSQLDVTVDVAATEVRAVVSDDGRGFDPGGPDRAGGGLPSMRERTLLLRGRLAVVSEPGKGTRVEVRVPLLESGL